MTFTVASDSFKDGDTCQVISFSPPILGLAAPDATGRLITLVQSPSVDGHSVDTGVIVTN